MFIIVSMTHTYDVNEHLDNVQSVHADMAMNFYHRRPHTNIPVPQVSILNDSEDALHPAYPNLSSRHLTWPIPHERSTVVRERLRELSHAIGKCTSNGLVLALKKSKRKFLFLFTSGRLVSTVIGYGIASVVLSFYQS